MNKVILSLPKSILRNYVIKHFSELTIDDFFQVVKKIDIPFYYISSNKVLCKSSKVLLYMLDINNKAFEQFDIEAFNDKVIQKIADLNDELFSSHIKKYPVLLSNKKICLKMIKIYPDLIKFLKSEQLTEEIVSILENETYYIPDLEDYDRFPILLKSEKLINKSVVNFPELFLRVDDPSDKFISNSLKGGFKPDINLFIERPNLRKSKSLLENAFKNDPNVIKFFNLDLLTSENIQSARDRGFIATEDEFKENPALTQHSLITEDALKNNPQLITMIDETWDIDYSVIINTLNEYKLTKEDLINNPALTKISSVMSCCPDLHLYYYYLEDKEKIDLLIDYLKNNKKLDVDSLPFLDKRFSGKADIDKLNELLNYTTIYIDEDDIDLQENHLINLDKIIYGVANKRYNQNKTSFKYSDIVSLNESLIELFKNAISEKNDNYISEYINDLYLFIGKSIPIEQLKIEIEKFYNIYLNTGSLSLKNTSDFCNKILNMHRDWYISEEKKKIEYEVKSKLKLTKKRKNSIIMSRKISEVKLLLYQGDYEQLGITSAQFRKDLNDTINSILNNKDIKKSGITIDADALKKLADCYRLFGGINEDQVKISLRIIDKEICSFIVKKFNQIKFKYAKNITLPEQEEIISNLDGLNHNNYIICDNERYLYNLSELLIDLDDNKLEIIMNNIHLIKNVMFLLPYVNLIKDLDINAFINILINFNKIKAKLFEAFKINSDIDIPSFILTNIDKVISLANNYSSVDNISIIALGNDVVSEIYDYTSPKYLDFYLKMLDRKKGIIPPVSVQTSKHYLESGRYADPERLLIGKKPQNDSCIDLLNSAGRRTYDEALLEESGDAILIRDSNKKLISRILIFRRGNVVQMVSHGYHPLSDIDICKKIADQIIQQATIKNDNIDYVFLSSSSAAFDSSEYIRIADSRFESKFPHADFSSFAILLSSKENVQESEINLDFDAKPLKNYNKERKKISYNPSTDEINRIKALSIVLETNPDKKESMKRNFEPFCDIEYDKVACGEDWYIAVNKNGTIEEVVLTVDIEKALEEIEEAKRIMGIFSTNKKEIDDMFSDDKKNTDVDKEKANTFS